MELPRATALVFGLLLAAATHAQPVFPSRPVTLVLPSAPGDPTDLIARVLQPKMSERLGQSFVVENRPGGSAVIASNAVAKAPADGHTLLLALSAHSINPIALKELPYDTFRDFAPVTLLARFALIVGASSSVKGSDLREFVAAAKGRGNVNFASPGAGTLSFLVGEEISRRSGLDAVHLAFRGGAPAVQAMLANQAQYGALPLNLLRAHFASGKLKPLAVTSPHWRSGPRQAALSQRPVSAQGVLTPRLRHSWTAATFLSRSNALAISGTILLTPATRNSLPAPKA